MGCARRRRGGTCGEFYRAAPGGIRTTEPFSQRRRYESLDWTAPRARSAMWAHAFSQDGGLAVLYGNIAVDGCIVKTGGCDPAEPHVHRTGAHLRKPGTERRGRYSRRPRAAGEVVVIRLRRPEGRARHAGDAVSTSYLNPKAWARLRADHRRPVFRVEAPASRSVTSHRSGRGWGARAGGRWRRNRDRYSAAHHPAGCERRGTGAAAGRHGGARRGGAGNRRRGSATVSKALQAYAAMATSASRGAVREF